MHVERSSELTIMEVRALDQAAASMYDEQPNEDVQCAALDPRRITKLDMLNYYSPPVSGNSDHADVDQWIETVSFIIKDLEHLLKLRHDMFWCHVIFDESFQASVESYLKLAPRPFDLVYFHLEDNIRTKQEVVHKLYFMVILRSSTHKETKSDFITPEVFGKILYDNFIFDVPKMMDVCVLYGNDNQKMVKKMIENIFKHQPQYFEDLQAVSGTLLQIMHDICQKCGLKNPTFPVKLSYNQKLGKCDLKTMSQNDFQDTLFYLRDFSESLRIFLEIYPPAVETLFQADVHMHLSVLYESIVPPLNEAFSKREFQEKHLQEALRNLQKSTQLNIINVVRVMIVQQCLDPLLQDVSHDEKTRLGETFVHTMTTLLSESRFMAHYASVYSFESDADIVCQASEVDDTSMAFIAQGIEQVTERFAHNFILAQTHGSSENGGNFYGKTTETVNYESTDPNELGACAALKEVSEIELESMITAVKDLLPELGEGFIELCLEEFNYDIESAIHALLEEKLPVPLQKLDRYMGRQKKETVITKEEFKDSGPIAGRRNIYDDDEFDVFSGKSVDKQKIHKGKKEKVNPNDLNDKSHIVQLKPLYDKYGHEDLGSAYDKEVHYYDYEDEYDDTYDSNVVGVDDADSVDELTVRRPFTTPRVLTQREDAGNDSRDESSEADDNDGSNKTSRDEFITNPALIRQRQEERRSSQEQRGVKPQRHHDVHGGPKGQGQSNEVLRNRAWKEKNKSTRVHHNRRNLADKKRMA